MNKRELLKALEIFDDEDNIFITLETQRPREKWTYECFDLNDVQENNDEIQFNIIKVVEE